MEKLREEFNIVRLCEYFKITRQAYYKSVKQNEKEVVMEEVIVELIYQIRRSNMRMGGKKLYRLLQQDICKINSSLGRDKFFDLLRERGLLVERRRKYAITTNSYHRFRIYKNRLLDFKAQCPHQVWVSDITYLRTEKGFVYLFLITDAYSRKIVGWDVKGSLGLEGALNTLAMALKQCPEPLGLIHHSDRGFQYCSNVYVNRLKANGIQISMAEAGNCYQNAIAERINGILKQEYGLDEILANEKEARKTASQGIKAYNEQRPHWSLGLKIPAEVHKLT
jgi:transposase InsO family protein